ncbi:hypothetical protein GPL15_03105 [Clostridium sp. MCC353]|uniref:PucR family transcriptional regulator n=1 Tax=Clostridium sp. MCC353 TaxID=2592646 RepID=UPI001C01E201|nr:helix-turn-helix domain-containing protein [Clostridium sp. MCC353]MBT9775497.1 hypothetical protein [Clostridium sp. MCC353]
MSHISYWMECAGAEPGRCHISFQQLPIIDTIRFVRNGQTFREDIIYIGTAREVAGILSDSGPGKPSGVTFLCSGYEDGLKDLASSCRSNLIYSDKDPFLLHDLADELVHRYRNWSNRFSQLSEPGHSIQDIVDYAAEITGFSIFLLNTANRVVFSKIKPALSDPALESMAVNGMMSTETAKLLIDPVSQSRILLKDLSPGYFCWVYKVMKQGTPISNMIFAAPEEARKFDGYTVMELTRQAIHRLMNSSDSLPYWAGEQFKILLQEIVEGKITDEYEINHRFSMISCGSGIFCSFILIEPAGSESLADISLPVLTELEELFPDSNTAIYDGSIVLLLSRPNRAFQPRPVFDTAAFTKLLQRYNAFASISNATSRRTLLRTHYIMTKRILALGRKLYPDSRERVYYFEDFAEYFMIDLSITSFNSLFGHDDIVLLMHPDAVKLVKYDKEHNSNLLEFVYHYCLNNCNMVQTAKSAYMHRNTAASRLAKVHELIRADLENGEIQQRMIFSYKVHRYYSRCSDMDLAERLEASGGVKNRGRQTHK